MPVDTPAAPASDPAGVRLRPATRADAPAIARLFLVSSDGLAAYIWGLMAPAMPGLTLEQIGAARYARDGVAFSWQNCTVAEAPGAAGGPGAVVAMLHAYRIDPPDPAAPPDPDPDPVLRPYQELEDPGSLYISGIAVLPDWRGHGIGNRLMAAAEARARAERLPRLSLICFEANAGAARLYRRLGFRVVGRRALVPHPCLHYQSGDALLMVHRLD